MRFLPVAFPGDQAANTALVVVERINRRAVCQRVTAQQARDDAIERIIHQARRCNASTTRPANRVL